MVRFRVLLNEVGRHGWNRVWNPVLHGYRGIPKVGQLGKEESFIKLPVLEAESPKWGRLLGSVSGKSPQGYTVSCWIASWLGAQITVQNRKLDNDSGAKFICLTAQSSKGRTVNAPPHTHHHHAIPPLTEALSPQETPSELIQATTKVKRDSVPPE